MKRVLTVGSALALLLVCLYGLASGAEHLRRSRALVYASMRGDLRAVKRALASGANPNVRGPKQMRAIDFAAHAGREDIIRCLVDKGASLEGHSGFGVTPLTAAVSRGHPRAAKLLLDLGAQVNGRNRDGSTALVAAARSPHWRANEQRLAIQALLSAGADVKATDDQRLSAWDYASRRSDTQLQAILRGKGAR